MEKGGAPLSRLAQPHWDPALTYWTITGPPGAIVEPQKQTPAAVRTRSLARAERPRLDEARQGLHDASDMNSAWRVASPGQSHAVAQQSAGGHVLDANPFCSGMFSSRG